MNATDYTYFNLRTHEFSVRHRGRVRTHADRLMVLPGDDRQKVEFRVSEPGRQRVLREQRKNVHSYVVGDAWTADTNVSEWTQVFDKQYGNPVAISYNPYKGGTFYRKDTSEAVRVAEACILISGHGNYPPMVLAYNPKP